MNEQQQNINEWLEEEEKHLCAGKTYEKMPSVVFAENRISVIEIDFSEPFQKWTGDSRGRSGQVTKAIIPCLQDGEFRNWWLNIRNPIYHEIIRRARKGQNLFKILQVGTQQNTMYKIID